MEINVSRQNRGFIGVGLSQPPDVVPAPKQKWMKRDEKMKNNERPEKRNSMLSELHRWSCTPQVISCNAALSACEKCGEWQHALDLLKLGAFHWHHVDPC